MGLSAFIALKYSSSDIRAIRNRRRSVIADPLRRIDKLNCFHDVSFAPVGPGRCIPQAVSVAYRSSKWRNERNAVFPARRHSR